MVWQNRDKPLHLEVVRWNQDMILQTASTSDYFADIGVVIC
jgi:hypothetical protein